MSILSLLLLEMQLLSKKKGVKNDQNAVLSKQACFQDS